MSDAWDDPDRPQPAGMTASRTESARAGVPPPSSVSSAHTASPERGAEVSDESAMGSLRPHTLVRRMLVGASATAVLQGASSAAGFAVAVVLARLLGESGYGSYAFAVACASVLTIPAGLGLNRFVVRGIATYEVKRQWGQLRGLVLGANKIVFVTSTGIAVLGCVIALTVLAPTYRWVFVVAMLLIPVNALVLLRQATMQAFGRIVTGQMPEYVIRPVILLGGIGVLAVADRRVLTPPIAMGVNVAAVSVAFVAGVLGLRKAIPEQARAIAPRYEVRKWIAAALPMMLIGGMWQVNGYVTTIAVGTLGGARDAGIYSAVEKGGEFIVLLLVAANMPFAPVIARMHARGDRAGLEHTAERIAQVTVLAASAVAAFFVFFPGTYLGIFGHGFASGGAALRILALGQLFNAVAGPVGSVLIMTGHERAAIWGVGSGLVTTLALSLALIPALGVTGAAVADAASFVVWNTVLVVLCRRLVAINATAFWPLSMASGRRRLLS